MRQDITLLFQKIESGDDAAAAELLPLLYDELRQLAASRLAQESPGHTLQATALVHEAYLRMVGPQGEPQRWENRAHFFGAAVEAMRRVLIDHARAKGAAKRGGDAKRLTLDPGSLTVADVPPEFIDLDTALTALELKDPQKAMLVKLRYFGGLSVRDTAEVLGISPTTADRHWAFARAWLFAALQDKK